MRNTARYASFIVFASVACMMSAQERPPSPQGINLYSVEREARWGATISAEIERSVIVLRSQDLDAYFGQLIGDPKFRVLVFHKTEGGVDGGSAGMPAKASSNTSGEVIALPPGTFFVSDRLLAESKDEAEFAKKIAHAMAHISLRHATKLDSKGGAGYAQLPAAFMGGGWEAYGSRDRAQVLVQIGFQKIAKKYEAEADKASAEILTGLNLDAAAFARAQAAVR